MEEKLGNLCDARAIFERALKQFTSPASDDSMSLWRAYELMETRAGNLKGAQAVYQRCTRASFADTVRSLFFSYTFCILMRPSNCYASPIFYADFLSNII
jgi:hypothetical protein